MPYVIGQSNIFIVGISILIVGVLMLRFYIARRIKRQAKEAINQEQQP